MEPLSPEKIAVLRQFDDAPLMAAAGQMDARVVFTHTLFFTGGGTQEGQIRALETLALLARDVEDQIAVMELPQGGLQRWDPARFREDSEDAIVRAFDRRPDQRDFDLAFHGTPDGTFSAFGGSVAAAPPLYDGYTDLNHLETSTTLMWDADHAFGRQIERMIAACALLKPVHGLAGFGLLFDRSGASTSSEARMVPVIKRFPGLHCGMDGTFKVEAAMNRPTPDRYFTINWLTAIGDAMMAQLPDGALDALPNSCPVHRYDGGVILQAGPHPQMGDANRGFVLEDYRAVQAVLAPLRFEAYRVGILPVPAPMDSRDETLDWITRFD